MNCKIYTFPSFEREAKRLNKRYKSFKSDLKDLMNELSSSPSLGADLGGGLRKVRMAIKSKGTGKSGGARIITVVLADIEDGLGLLYIYDKSERSTLKGKELTDLLKKNGLVCYAIPCCRCLPSSISNRESSFYSSSLFSSSPIRYFMS